MLRTILCLLLALGAMSSHVSAEVYEPLSHWNIDYGETSCDLKRIFKGESGEIQIQISQAFQLGGANLYIVSKPTGKKTFWKADVDFSIDETGAKLTKSSRFQINKEENIQIWQINQFDNGYLENLPNDVTLRLNTGKQPEIALKMTGMKAVDDALKQCQRNLYQTFGLDYGKMQTLSRQLKPDEKSRAWNAALEYPSTALRLDYEGTVWFMLSVDQEGQSENCTILRSSGYELLDNSPCAHLATRARFIPALDKDGQPIASEWISAVRFWIPK